jgi:16S rRNA processing protein RimM
VSDASRSQAIYLGRFVKAFGVKGELKFLRSDDFWRDALQSQLLEMRRVGEDGVVETGPVKIERARPHGGNYVVKLEGVETRTDAEQEIGGELFVPREELDVEPPNEERPFQVLGLTVKTEEGGLVGRIRSVIYSAAHPIYDVEGEEGDVMIPAVPEFVVARDDEAGVITIRPIPGLLDG